MEHCCRSHHTILPLAFALSMGLVFSLYSLILYYWPEQGVRMLADVHHLTNITIELSMRSFISGLIQTMVWSFLVIWLTGVIYCYLGGHKYHPSHPGHENRR